MAFTARSTQQFSIIENDAFGAGMATTYRVAEMRLVGCDRHNAQAYLLSAGLSGQEITMSPLGVSAPSRLIFFMANHPVDARLGASNATMISALQQAVFGANVSSLFLDIGSQVTTILIEAVGGSAATLQVTLPLS